MSKSDWHLDRRVSIGIIAAVAFQIIAFSYSYGQVESRVVTLEATDDRLATMPERLVRVEVLLEEIRDR